MPRATQYEQDDGSVPFAEWFDSLPSQPAAKVTVAITRMEKGNFGDNESVGGGVRERKLHFQKGYRIYYAIDGEDLVLLLWGGTKSRQHKDVDKAKEYWADYKARKKTTSKKLAKKELKKKANKKTKPRNKK